MTPLKPYIVRALYDWINDNGMTPYLLVDSTHPLAVVPQDFAQDGRIVLNLRPEAIQHLQLGDAAIRFNARFNGRPLQVDVPLAAVLALYARENGRGMVFDAQDEAEAGVTSEMPGAQLGPESDPEPPASPPAGKKKSHLTLVK